MDMSEVILCKDSKPEITQIKEKMSTTEVHSGKLPLCGLLGCLLGKQRQKQVCRRGGAGRLGLH